MSVFWNVDIEVVCLRFGVYVDWMWCLVNKVYDFGFFWIVDLIGKYGGIEEYG